MSQISVGRYDEVLAEIGADGNLREACFSADGRRVAIIKMHSSGCSILWTIGSESQVDFAEHLVMNYSGNITACKVRKQGQSFIAINGQFGAEYSWVSDPVVGTLQDTVAYWARNSRMAPQEEYWLVYHKNASAPERFGPFYSYGHVMIRNDGTPVFAIQEKGRSALFDNGAIRTEWLDWIRAPTLDSQENIWCWGRRGDTWVLFRNDEAVDQSDEICSVSGPYWDPEGIKAAYWKNKEGSWYLICNGDSQRIDGKPLDCVGDIVFAANGSMAYSISRDDGVVVVIDGDRSESYDAVGKIVFGADGLSHAFKARKKDTEFVVFNGRRLAPHDVSLSNIFGLPNVLDDVPVLRSDGTQVAFCGRLGDKEFVGVDDWRSDSFDAVTIGPAFDPFERLVIHGGVRRGKEFVAVGTEMSEPFDRIWSLGSARFFHTMRCVPRLINENSLAFGVLADNKLRKYVLSFYANQVT